MLSSPRVLLIENIEDARKALNEIGVDEKGIEIMAPKAIYRTVKIDQIDSRAANIVKQEMLSRGGEAALSKDVYLLNESKTDVIVMGTLRHYKELYLKLKQQPFNLSQIADEIRETLSNFEMESKVVYAGKYRLDLLRRTYIMGILNVTPDSFSDGGKFNALDKILSRAIEMVEDGADIIDIGGESTRPGAEPISLDEELKRVIPVIKRISSVINKPISVDTYKSKVAAQAIEAGASIVNDVSGLRFDEDMPELIAKSGLPVVIMHMKGEPHNMQQDPEYKSVIGEISDFLNNQAEMAISKGIAKDRIILDPGIGFGKTLMHNLEIMHFLSEFKSLGYPILIGPSRKSFIGGILDLPVEDRLEGTAAAIAYGISQGANIVRVHDVKEMSMVSKMTDAMMRNT
jgi:dihydropteroate synthase